MQILLNAMCCRLAGRGRGGGGGGEDLKRKTALDFSIEEVEFDVSMSNEWHFADGRVCARVSVFRTF